MSARNQSFHCRLHARRAHVLVAAALFACASSLFAYAAAAPLPAAAELAQQQEIVISTHRLQVELPSSIAVRSLNAAAIERAQVGSLSELLQRQPGVYLTDAFNDGTQSTVSLRGFGGNASANALVVVDGRELNQADLSAPDLDSLSLLDIARIEILSGASAVRYGDQSTGGVVYLSTLRAGAGHSQLRAALGSDGREELDALFDSELDSGLGDGETFGATGLRLSAKRHRSDGARDGAEADKTDLLGRISQSVGAGRFDLELQHVEQDRVALGALTRSQKRADRRQSGSILETDARTRNARLGWQQPFAAHRFEFDAFQTRFDSESPSSSPTFGNSLTSIEREQTAFDPRLLLQFDRLAVSVGADIDRHELQFANASDAFGNSGSRQRIDSRAGWLALTMPIDDAFSVEAGARAARVNTRASGFAGESEIRAHTREHASAFELGARWQADPAWQFGARIATGFRLPKADEQISVFSGLNLLRTQDAVSYELRAMHVSAMLRAQLQVYRIDLQHEIDFDPLGGFFGENLNLPDTRHSGIAASAEIDLTPTLQLGFDAEYIRARIEGGDASSGNTVPFVPSRRAGMFADWRPLASLALRTEARYVGPRYAIGDFANDAGEQGGYTTIDLAASYQWQDFKLGLRIDNLFDRDYDALISYVTFLGPPDLLTFQPDGGRRMLLTIRWQPD